MALAFRWRGEPAFERLRGVRARHRARRWRGRVEQKKPIFLILDGDVAQTMGGILKEDCAWPPRCW